MSASPTVIGERFELGERVGSGTTGEVHRARDRTTNEIVALKMFHAGAMLSSARFRREARALASLSHPAIVRHVAHGTDETGRPYLAMAWAPGGDLGDRVAESGPLGVRDAVALAIRIGDALGVAHRAGYVHRDVKPSNVLLGEAGISDAVLADFGVARIAHGTEVTTPGTIIGTASFMAPEQARALPIVDARADVFALGALTFFGLVGRPPFDGSDLLAVLTKVLFFEPPLVSDERADVPVELAAIVNRLLAKDPDARPRDGTEAAELFRRLDPALLDAPEPTTRRARADGELARAERKIFAVVLAHLGTSDAAGPPSRRASISSVPKRFTEALAPFGASVAPLRDGSFAAFLTDRAASDLALRGARSALVLASLLPNARIAIATGLDSVDVDKPTGETIDRAASLTRAEAAPHAIRIDEATAGLLKARFVIETTAGVTTLGPELDPMRSTHLLGRPTPFVGRERELAALRGLCDESRGESVARTALVMGGAGSGKTRLAAELVRVLSEDADRPTVWVARADLERAESPLWLAGELVAVATSSRVGAGDARNDALRAHLTRVLPADAVERVADFLGELCGAPAKTESPWLFAARLDARLMAEQCARAFEELVMATLRAGPLVIVLEDLHDADAASLKLFDATLRAAEERSLTVIGAARPSIEDRFPDLWQGRDPLRIALGPLSSRAADRLVRACLGAGVSAEVASSIVTRGGGNAFCIEELIRQASEGQPEVTPQSVLAVAAERLSSLPAEGRRLLRAASVLGETFAPAAVAALLPDLGEDALGSWSASLVDREVLERLRDSKGELRFRHALLREAAYASLTPDDRQKAHARAARWLEETQSSDDAQLAEHFARAAEPRAAGERMARAAEKALFANDLDGAIGKARRARELCESAAAPGKLLLVEADALAWRGERLLATERCLEAFASAEEGSAPFFDAGALAIELLLRDQDLSRIGPITEKLVSTSLLDGGRATQRARFFALSRVVQWALMAGRAPLAESVLSGLARHPLLGSDPIIDARLSHARAALAQFQGRPEAYLEHVAQHLGYVERMGDVRGTATQRLTLAYAKLSLGRYREAEDDLEAAEALATMLRLPPLRANALQNLGVVSCRTGRTEEGLAQQAEAIRLLEEQGDDFMRSASLKYVAEAELDRGRVSEAVESARTSVALVPTMPSIAASARAVLARALLRTGDSVGALEQAEIGWQTLRDSGGVDEGEATVRLAMIEALEASERRDEARTLRADAKRRLESQLSQLTDPANREAFSAITEHRLLLGPAPDGLEPSQLSSMGPPK